VACACFGTVANRFGEPQRGHAAAVADRGLGDDYREWKDAAMVEQVARRIEHAVFGVAEAVEESFGACRVRGEA
jgi:hypothetical protein